MHDNFVTLYLMLVSNCYFFINKRTKDHVVSKYRYKSRMRTVNGHVTFPGCFEKTIIEDLGKILVFFRKLLIKTVIFKVRSVFSMV